MLKFITADMILFVLFIFIIILLIVAYLDYKNEKVNSKFFCKYILPNKD